MCATRDAGTSSVCWGLIVGFSKLGVMTQFNGTPALKSIIEFVMELLEIRHQDFACFMQEY